MNHKKINNILICAELVYAIPNHADKKRLVNAHEAVDRIVFIDRGIVRILLMHRIDIKIHLRYMYSE